MPTPSCQRAPPEESTRSLGFAEGVEPLPPLDPPCPHSLRRPHNERGIALLRKRVRPRNWAQNALDAGKPPKATTRPYTRHILGIDSGVQSHPKATSKPTDSQPIATPKPP